MIIKEHLCLLFCIQNFFYYNFSICSIAKLWFRPWLNIYNMYIFIYIKLTKVVVDSVYRIGRCFPYRKYTQPCNSTSIPCTLFNRKLSISSACGNVSWIPPISKSPDLNNFNRIRVYAIRSFRCTYISSIVSFSLKGMIGRNRLPRFRRYIEILSPGVFISLNLYLYVRKF